MAEAAIAFGSNLGDRQRHIALAIDHLTRDDRVEIIGLSHFHETEPWGDPDQDRYINACALVATDFTPQELLARCLEVEESLGRVRDPANRYGPRTIDLDIIFYDDVKLDEPDLVLPHPRLFERAFVLVPLIEVTGERIIAGRSLDQALSGLDASGVRRFETLEPL